MGLKNVGRASLSNSGKAVNFKVHTETGQELLTVSIKSLKELIEGEKSYINVALVVPDSEGEVEEKESKWVEKK